MTDGTVLIQEILTGTWQRLTPDINGSYLHGTWSTLDVDIPEGHGGALVSTDYVLSFGRRLLVAVSLAIDAFAATGAKDADMSELVRWKIDGETCGTAWKMMDIPSGLK